MLEELLGHLSIPKIAAAAAAIFFLIYIVRWIDTERKIKALGGHGPRIPTRLPLGIDVIYNGIRATMQHRNKELWQSFFQNHGKGGHTVEVTIMNLRVAFTDDPENIKALLATQFRDFGKGEPFRRDWEDFLGDSIFTTDLDKWHNSRQLIRPQFIKDRLSDLDLFEKHVSTLLSLIPKNGASVDISNLFYRYTLDAATDFLLGRSVDSLTNSQVKFADAFAEVQRVQNIIARAGPLNKLVPRRSFYRGLKVINEFVNPFIEQALLLSPEELATKTKSESGYTFLHALASYTRDRKVLRDQLVAVLLAGRDTTAGTLSWAFFEMARNPEVVAKLRREIIEKVGATGRPTYDDLKSMKYLTHVINETLRLYPPVPFNVRLALHDTHLPRGGGPDGTGPLAILKDSPVGYSTLTMQRREDLFGPDVEEFRPERWETWTPKSWQYIPFNGGPRICIGQQFALTEMLYTIVRIFQKFEKLEIRMRDEEQFLKAEVVLAPGGGVWVGLREPQTA